MRGKAHVRNNRNGFLLLSSGAGVKEADSISLLQFEK